MARADRARACELDPALTVREIVTLFAGFYRAPRSVDETVELVGLGDKRDARVGTLSGGQRRRVDVAVGIIGDPELVFLDEPTTGFDPSARRDAWNMIEGLQQLGKTIFLTTHYMDEAQYLAHEVAIIAEGRILAQGPPSSLAGRDTAATTIRFFLAQGAPELPEGLRAAAATGEDGFVTIITEDPTRALHELTGWALERGEALSALEVSRPSLEDVYLQITGGVGGSE